MDFGGHRLLAGPLREDLSVRTSFLTHRRDSVLPRPPATTDSAQEPEDRPTVDVASSLLLTPHSRPAGCMHLGQTSVCSAVG